MTGTLGTASLTLLCGCPNLRREDAENASELKTLSLVDKENDEHLTDGAVEVKESIHGFKDARKSDIEVCIFSWDPPFLSLCWNSDIRIELTLSSPPYAIERAFARSSSPLAWDLRGSLPSDL
jgi:hypothetical protein